MDFLNSKTRQNLAKAFAAECQAGARYQFMATKAQTEKLFYVKDTMKMLAKNEMAHAKLFYDYIVENSEKDSVVEFDADYSYLEAKLEISLRKESEIERNEFNTIYPEFARVAREEGFEEIAESFEKVAKVEYSHFKLLEFLYTRYKNNNIYKNRLSNLLRCTNCGHLESNGEVWKKCPLCSLEQGYIMIDYNDIFEESSNVIIE